MLSHSAHSADAAPLAHRRGRPAALFSFALACALSATTARAQTGSATEPAPPEAAVVEDGASTDAAPPAATDAEPVDEAASTGEPAVSEADAATDPTKPSEASASEAPTVTETVEETVVEVTEEEPAPVDVDDDEPTILERQIVAFVASGVAVTSLAVGVVVGFLAWQQFNCLQNVLTCNESLQEPIHGADYFTARSNVEHLALIADMAYLFAGAATIVAITGFIRGFFFVDDGDDAEEATTSKATPARREDAFAALAAGGAE